MKVYERRVNGYRVRQRLSDEHAERLGLIAVKPAEAPEERPVETAKVEPENKSGSSRGGGRGRKLNRD